MQHFGFSMGLKQTNNCCVYVTEVTGLTKYTLINAKQSHILYACICKKIMCFSLQVKNKPRDGCTQVCVYYRTVCMDVNKSSSQFGSMPLKRVDPIPEWDIPSIFRCSHYHTQVMIDVTGHIPSIFCLPSAEYFFPRNLVASANFYYFFKGNKSPVCIIFLVLARQCEW